MNHHASMNRVYRLIWSEVRSAWVPVAETARGRGKSGRGRSGRARSMTGRNAIAAAISLALAPLAYSGSAASLLAQATRPMGHATSPCVTPVCVSTSTSLSATSHPLGGKVTSGSATITQVGNTTDIRQSSTDVAIDWLSFNVGPQATVDFLQPTTSSVAVNRISRTNGSEILGHLDANGQVYLINPNGIIFGKGSEVNVGGLVASTLDVTDPGASGSTRSFEGSGTGSIVNQGTISAANGGYVALLGNRVSNEGVISAQLGTVALGAGSAVTLDFSGDRLIHLQVDQSTLNDLAQNKQLIEADGGRVIMTAGAQRALLASVVNNTGVIEARTVENHAGTIELLGGMSAGTVKVGGTLDASAAQSGDGGTIETNAAHVEVANDAKVTTAASKGLTGSWLIDPEDFTVAATGGDITGAALSKELATTSITLESSSGTKAPSGSGNINVDDAVSWSANTSLTLTAANNVNVNKNITATGSTAALSIKPDTANGTEPASGTGTFNLGAGVSITMSGANESLSISTPRDTLGTGAQINLVNVSPTSTTALVIGGTEYTVINRLGAAGSTTRTDLQGINGNLSGHYALGSNIDASATATWNLVGATTPVYTGFTPIGSAAAPFNGTLEGLGHTIGNLTIDLPAASDVGLIGKSGKTAVIQNVGLVGGSVSGAGYVGALVGQSSGTVSDSYATTNVTGANYVVGGLVGQTSGTVSDSYATGSVSGTGNGIGGLVGQNNGSISNSYATGSPIGAHLEVGGLVGQNAAAVSDSYATGNVKGSGDVGGLVGYNLKGGAITTSYAKGGVSGSGGTFGGLVGNSPGSVTNSYWDTTTSGQSTSAAGTGLTTAQMQTAASFTGFNFTSSPDAAGNNWIMVDINGTLNNAGGAQGATFPMLASEYTTRIDNSHQLQLMAMNPAATYDLSQNIDASTTGTSADVWGSSGFIPIGSTSAAFTGTLDGLGHIISGLTINLPSNTDVGLIGVASAGSVIEEVGLMGGSISGSSYVGALVGKSQGTVNDAYATGAVSGARYVVGGLVGQSSGTVSESYATGNVSGTGNGVGGLVGQNNGTVTNSYATGGTIGGDLEVGGLVGQNQGSVIDSYTTGSVKGVGDVGGLVGYNVGAHSAIGTSYSVGKVSGSTGSTVGGLVGANTGNIAESYWDVTTSGQSGTLGGATGLTTAQMRTAANFAGFGFTSTPGASGNNWVMVDINGSLNNAGEAAGAVFPMLASEYSTTIDNAHELQLMAMNLGATYTLGQNINASATGTSADVWGLAGFIPIGVFSPNVPSSTPFTGTLNGLGHSVSDLSVTTSVYTYTNAGLIGIAGPGSVIEEVGMVGGSFSGAYAGALVGYNEGTVNNSYSTANNTTAPYGEGGLVGYNSGTITNSYSTANVGNPDDGGGGLVGLNETGGKIIDSYATGNVAGGGGLVESNSGTITNSYATGNVTGGGGLVESNSGTITNSYATGNVTYGGGLVQKNTGTISGSHATGDVSTVLPGYVGGLVSINYGTVNSSYARGSVTGSYAKGAVNGASYMGGLIGINGGTVTSSNASGHVTGPGVIGGLVGTNSGTVSSSYATGNVTGTGNYVGGLVGINGNDNPQNPATVSNSWASGSVSSTGNYVGGLTGYDDGSVTHSYAKGNVSGANDVAGLVGYVYQGTVSGSNASGTVSGASDVGGLIANNSGTVSNDSATGSVSGTGGNVGGLIGYNSGGSTVSDSDAAGSVNGAGNYVGGLIGYNVKGTVNGSGATGSVKGTGSYVGGLVGYNSSGNTISSSYATGNVTGASYAGGLVGYNTGTVNIGYAKGTVSGATSVGGLVGDNVGSVANTFATGDVSGSSNVGGLVGITTGPVSTSYATGSVTGSSEVGGLSGNTVGAGTVSASFWNTTTSGVTISAGGTPLTTAQMETESKFTVADWNFTSVWYMTNGVTFPMLQAFESTPAMTANDATATHASIVYRGGK
jgi:filamentous hemagglutinin family protein